MSLLRHLANCIHQTLNDELRIVDNIKPELYDLHSLKALFREFFKEVENQFDMRDYTRLCMSMPLIWKRSSFNENDYKVSYRKDIDADIFAVHWGYFITNYFVRNRIDLDLLCIKNEKTNKKQLFLGGFQKRYVTDSKRLDENGKDVSEKRSDEFGKYTSGDLMKDLSMYSYEWEYYSRVFENQDKTELKEHIDNDDTCNLSIDEATLSDFLLFKDFLQHIINNIEQGNYQ